jgi:DNA-binding MarR family transcriptional regulator
MVRKSIDIDRAQIQALARFRSEIRRFLLFSERAAASEGILPQQYQFLLQIAGAPDDTPITISYMANAMGLQHHSAVELSKRCEQALLIRRMQNPSNRRYVLLELTDRGVLALVRLAEIHARELRELAPGLIRTLRRISKSRVVG